MQGQEAGAGGREQGAGAGRQGAGRQGRKQKQKQAQTGVCSPEIAGRRSITWRQPVCPERRMVTVATPWVLARSIASSTARCVRYLFDSE